MGIEMRPRNIKLGERAEKQLCEIQDALHPFCVNRSSTIRTVVDLMHKIIFTPGIVEKLGLLLQGVPCTYFVRTQSSPSIEGGHPGPVRVDLSEKRNPRRTGTTSTYRVTASVVSEVLCRPAADRKDRNAWLLLSAGAEERVA